MTWLQINRICITGQISMKEVSNLSLPLLHSRSAHKLSSSPYGCMGSETEYISSMGQLALLLYQVQDFNYRMFIPKVVINHPQVSLYCSMHNIIITSVLVHNSNCICCRTTTFWLSRVQLCFKNRHYNTSMTWEYNKAIKAFKNVIRIRDIDSRMEKCKGNKGWVRT